MSVAAEAVLEQVRKLSPGEQQQILGELLRLVPSRVRHDQGPFPTVKVPGGVITSDQVAEALEDE